MNVPINPNAAAQRELRVAKVSELYLAGRSMREIAAELQVAVGTVFRDLRQAHEMWRSRATDARQKWIDRELSTLDWVEYEATKAWYRTIGKVKTVRSESGSGPNGATDKESTTTEILAGDPRFLEQIRGCVADRRKLLGIDAPTRTSFENPDGSPLLTGIKVVEVGS